MKIDKVVEISQKEQKIQIEKRREKKIRNLDDWSKRFNI